MPHFIDHTNFVKKQTFSAAVIVDSAGKQVGRVIVRFTDSQIGYNHEVGVIFYPAELNFSDTTKGNTYSMPGSLYHIFDNAGIKCFTRSRQVCGYGSKNNAHIMYDSLSDFNDIVKIKYQRKSYTLMWAL